ncbi:MAG: hypothetical protein Fur0043_02980 [Anaerolineales bacterium]
MQKSIIIQRLLSVLTFLLTAFLLSRSPADADLWWHLRAGQVMWTQKNILLTDVFSYTRAGAPWVNAFWLSDLLLYGLYSLGKPFALATFVALLGALTFYVVSKNLKGNPFTNSFILLLAAVTAAPVWGPRPQILSFLFVALLDFWLIRQQPLEYLPPFFALWANIHGGWIWGFLLLAAHVAGLFVRSLFQTEERLPLRRQALRLLGWTALSALAIGVNPNGLAIWKLPFQQVDVSLQIQEWLSPDFHRIDFHPFLWMIFLLLLIAPYASRPRNYPQLFKTLGFAYLTFVAQRNIALFAITALPLLAEWLHSFWQAIPWKIRLTSHPELPPRLVSILNILLVILLTLMVGGNLYLVSQPKRVQENYPVGAVAWLHSHQPPGRLFNSYNWGGYLTWVLPEYPIFIDGRADLYGNDLIQQWHDVVNAQSNALDILDAWDVDIVLLEPERPIVEVLNKNGWEEVYEDQEAIIFIHH